ncbi:MAG TPA: sigma-70 family RNA polymerase sigma factor [Telluria sp.]|jgi:RNA polymerase sigma-70 factor (ECF subfamily)
MQASADPDAALFSQLRPRLIAIGCRIVGNLAEAEDVVQDCFLKWQGAEQAALATPAAWLTTVVQHHAIDHLRKRARDALAARIATELVPDIPPELPEDNLLRRLALEEALARMAACLSPAEQLALVLHEVFECAHADIAAALGTTTPNARQHLARARRHLRENQDEAAPEEKLSRELIRRFQAAINSVDVPTMVTLLAGEQPVSVCDTPQMRLHRACPANDAAYSQLLAS